MAPRRLGDCRAGGKAAYPPFSGRVALMKVGKTHRLLGRIGVGAQSEGGHAGRPYGSAPGADELPV